MSEDCIQIFATRFKKLREAEDGETTYKGYRCELYVDGEYLCEFTKGLVSWRIASAGRFTYNAGNYEHVGIRGFSRAAYKLDIECGINI